MNATFDLIENNVGMITRKTTGAYAVQTRTETMECTLAGRLRHAGLTDGLTVGDLVRLAPAGNSGWQIIETLPRRNQLSRRSAVPMPGAHAHEQVIAANVDQVIPVFAAADPAPHWNMLDRYLVSAEAAEIPALVCITKLDLTQTAAGEPEADLLAVVEEYRRIGYPVMMVSARTGAGLEALRQVLQGRVSVLLGKSGVGKSSLLNALEPGLGLRVSAVSEYTGKGRHTTTHLEMFMLEYGGAIIDTPGVREFGLWDVAEDDLALFYPEMRPYVGRCRFGLDCRHDEEPGCANRKAVMDGQISPRRYQSYLRLQVEA